VGAQWTGFPDPVPDFNSTEKNEEAQIDISSPFLCPPSSTKPLWNLCKSVKLIFAMRGGEG
jgi:hypothetical protein